MSHRPAFEIQTNFNTSGNGWSGAKSAHVLREHNSKDDFYDFKPLFKSKNEFEDNCFSASEKKSNDYLSLNEISENEIKPLLFAQVNSSFGLDAQHDEFFASQKETFENISSKGDIFGSITTESNFGSFVPNTDTFGSFHGKSDDKFGSFTAEIKSPETFFMSSTQGSKAKRSPIKPQIFTNKFNPSHVPEIKSAHVFGTGFFSQPQDTFYESFRPAIQSAFPNVRPFSFADDQPVDEFDNNFNPYIPGDFEIKTFGAGYEDFSGDESFQAEFKPHARTQSYKVPNRIKESNLAHSLESLHSVPDKFLERPVLSKIKTNVQSHPHPATAHPISKSFLTPPDKMAHSAHATSYYSPFEQPTIDLSIRLQNTSLLKNPVSPNSKPASPVLVQLNPASFLSPPSSPAGKCGF